ncbi:MAG: hypothetical protein JWL81_3328, partial [Verrucomicrobiales bacterium]|nr:hypothetical protein [Verrucomicrobiales bacterium]
MICQSGLILTETAGDAAGFPWVDDAVGRETRSWLEPMVSAGPEQWVANAPTDLRLLRVGELVLPVSVDTDDAGRSYVVSPWAQYVAYAEEEVRRLANPWWRAGSMAAFHSLRPWMRRRAMDRVVQVNNWLVSTNLWADGMHGQVRPTVDFLRTIWPDRPVLLRSLDEQAQPDLIRECQGVGARMIFSRVVTWQDPTKADFWRNRQLRVDRKRGAREGWTFRELGPADEAMAPVLRRFYQALYLEKYSRLNPDFTELFFREALNKGFVRIELLLDASGVP